MNGCEQHLPVRGSHAPADTSSTNNDKIRELSDLICFMASRPPKQPAYQSTADVVPSRTGYFHERSHVARVSLQLCHCNGTYEDHRFVSAGPCPRRTRRRRALGSSRRPRRGDGRQARRRWRDDGLDAFVGDNGVERHGRSERRSPGSTRSARSRSSRTSSPSSSACARSRGTAARSLASR